jgi:hypothetical protein
MWGTLREITQDQGVVVADAVKADKDRGLPARSSLLNYQRYRETASLLDSRIKL